MSRSAHQASATPRPYATATIALLAAAVIAGCGTSGIAREAGRAEASVTTASTSRLTQLAPASLITSRLQRTGPARLEGVPLGLPQNVTSGDARLQVTVRAVIDPLTGSGAQHPAGTEVIAIDVQIRNAGPATYNSSATGDFSVEVSRGPVTPLLVPSGRCRTPLNDFDRDITAGEDRVGCVAFSVDRRALLESVIFSPHAATAGRLSWRP
jgi:hypothetical protein